MYISLFPCHVLWPDCVRSVQKFRSCGESCGKLLFFFLKHRGARQKNSHVCRLCSTSSRAAQNKNQWRCKAPGCTFRGDKALFQMWRNTQKNPDRVNGRQKCNTCFASWSSDERQRALRLNDVAKHITKSGDK